MADAKNETPETPETPALTRAEIRALLFSKVEHRRIPVEVQEGLILELVRPSEREFQEVAAQFTTIDAENGVATQDLVSAMTEIVRDCTVHPGTGEKIFEDGDDLLSGPYGGWFAKLRDSLTGVLGNAEQEMGNSEQIRDSSLGITSPSNSVAPPGS